MNNLILNIIYSVCFFCMLIPAQAQKKQNIGILLDKDLMSLKGPVHKVYFRYVHLKDSLPLKYKRKFMVENDYIGRGAPYFEFTKEGFLKKEINTSEYQKPFDSVAVKYDLITFYNLDLKDYNKKKNYKTYIDRNYGHSSQELLLKVNKGFDSYSYMQMQEIKHINEYEYIEDLYDYVYDNKGRVIKTKIYTILPTRQEKYGKLKIRPENLFVTLLHSYDEKNRIVEQKVIGGSMAKENDATPFQFLDTWAYVGSQGASIKYKYDTQDRLVQIQFYGQVYEERMLLSQENYTYHPTKGYMLTKTKMVDDVSGYDNPTRGFILTYNEQGDIIRRENIPNNDWMKFLTKKRIYKEYDPNYKEENPYQAYFKDIQNRYYKYEYDQYNNWIKCYMYREDTPNGTPSIIAERKIEYYN